MSPISQSTVLSHRPCAPTTAPARISAFTLTELLVVMAVIAILATVLVSVIGSVRQRAEQTQGVVSMRSVGVAVLLYTSDNGGKLPGPLWVTHVAAKTGSTRNLADNIAPYLGIDLIPDNRLIASIANPRLVVQSNSNPEIPHYYALHGIRDSEGEWITGGLDPWGYPAHGTYPEPGMLNAVPDAPRQIMLKDLDKLVTGPRGYPRGNQYPLAPDTPIYANSRNVLYFDGRVETEEIK